MSNGREENMADTIVKNLLRKTRRKCSDEEMQTEAHISLVHKKIQFSLVAITTDINCMDWIEKFAGFDFPQQKPDFETLQIPIST